MKRRAMGSRPSDSPEAGSGETGLDLTIHADEGRNLKPFLMEHLLKAHQLLEPSLREMSLAMVSDSKMSRLHKEFLDIDGPTDVMTFPLEFDARGNATAGEVVVCVPEARRQSK